MRNRKWPVLAVLAAAFLLPIAAHAYDNEPTGFRGIPWGASIDEVRGKMNSWWFVRDVDPGTVEYHSHANLAMNGIELKENYFQFYKGRFMAGIMEASYAHGGSMLDTLIARFGQPTQSAHYRRYLWQGPTTAIVYLCSKRNDYCRVGFESVKLIAEQRADLGKSAREDPDF